LVLISLLMDMGWWALVHFEEVVNEYLASLPNMIANEAAEAFGLIESHDGLSSAEVEVQVSRMACARRGARGCW